MRGQCALVRATVPDHLPSPERDAIYARFGVRDELLVQLGGVCGMSVHHQEDLVVHARDQATQDFAEDFAIEPAFDRHEAQVTLGGDG